MHHYHLYIFMYRKVVTKSQHDEIYLCRLVDILCINRERLYRSHSHDRYYMFSYESNDRRISLRADHVRYGGMEVTVHIQNKKLGYTKTSSVLNRKLSNVNKLLKHHNLW